MLKKKEDTYEIDRELTGKLAIESNAKLQEKVEELEEEIRKLKETIKDHQFYEEKLEHRIIELEELLHWE